VVNAIWAYSGLIIVLAMIAGVIAVTSERRPQATTLALLSGAAFLVPVAQLHFQTTWSLDKHLAYGIWFAAMAVGYGASKLVRRLPGASKPLVALFCALALLYPAVASGQSAQQAYQGWANSSPFINAFEPVLAHSHGLVFASAQEHIAQYYTPQGDDWTRWDLKDLPLNPTGVPHRLWAEYYAAVLRHEDYGVIALFYATSFSSVKLPASLLLAPHGTHIYDDLLSLVGVNSGEPGLPALTVALEHDPAYKLVSVGPFNSAHVSGIYAIWREGAAQ
jgi:hypothetical protein